MLESACLSSATCLELPLQNQREVVCSSIAFAQRLKLLCNFGQKAVSFASNGSAPEFKWTGHIKTDFDVSVKLISRNLEVRN